jgi:release factor glutamine methyltransferase
MQATPAQQWLIQIQQILEPHPAAQAEARLICFYLLREEFEELEKPSELLFTKFTPSKSIKTSAQEIAMKRGTGIPLQHLLGFQYFLNHEYAVSPDVLIPRPETEILVTAAMEHASSQMNADKLAPEFMFFELGLGSGILSGELLSEFPKAHAAASDVSPAAISIAKKNLAALGVLNRIQILTTTNPDSGFEIFQSQGQSDLVISNPPYVAVTDEIEDQVKNHEPHAALFPPQHPNYFYVNFIEHAKNILKPDGAAFFEIPHERADSLRVLFQAKGFKCKLHDDLTGRPRVLMVKF